MLTRQHRVKLANSGNGYVEAACTHISTLFETSMLSHSWVLWCKTCSWFYKRAWSSNRTMTLVTVHTHKCKSFLERCNTLKSSTRKVDVRSYAPAAGTTKKTLACSCLFLFRSCPLLHHNNWDISHMLSESLKWLSLWYSCQTLSTSMCCAWQQNWTIFWASL
jgi:hypothetical protein